MKAAVAVAVFVAAVALALAAVQRNGENALHDYAHKQALAIRAALVKRCMAGNRSRARTNVRIHVLRDFIGGAAEARQEAARLATSPADAKLNQDAATRYRRDLARIVYEKPIDCERAIPLP